jgi:GR25 family glycosyltransferase involved in LPS biosynthesis
MKSFVITIIDNKKSVQVADRCIKSGIKFDINIKYKPAITPKNNPIALAETYDIPIEGFKEIYSRFENCLSAFLSHFELWQKCVEDNEEYLILEHDAIIISPIPAFVNYKHLVNFGEPSYGKIRQPMMLGVNPLTSKQYLPGAHAYMLKPSGARMLVERARLTAMPTDLFINKTNFPWLEEYYPWPVKVNDSFTTIQNKRGCIAKHNYGETYEII